MDGKLEIKQNTFNIFITISNKLFEIKQYEQI